MLLACLPWHVRPPPPSPPLPLTAPLSRGPAAAERAERAMNETRAARTIATYHVFECTRGVRHDVAIFYEDTGAAAPHADVDTRHSGQPMTCFRGKPKNGGEAYATPRPLAVLQPNIPKYATKLPFPLHSYTN
ncbi:hypothetical protein RR46_11965 [Papilio xuthus]|uniref:Uncharacterized protein n=1 Tax=Papilio xuthus TaxID=66420 RepID=A0A194PNF2_PAPXU|nr:hypothetical protein RR46_11965 [Papilio xuthus]